MKVGYAIFKFVIEIKIVVKDIFRKNGSDHTVLNGIGLIGPEIIRGLSDLFRIQDTVFFSVYRNDQAGLIAFKITGCDLYTVFQTVFNI